MVFLIQRTLIWCLLFWGLVCGAVAYADKIYLKDGTVQESDRVWKSTSYIHFILSGTQGVEIRYAKEIVARVQIDGVEEVIGDKAPEITPVKEGHKTLPNAGEPDNSVENESIFDPADEREPSTPPMDIDRQMIKAHKGLEFYAPRRENRYWAASSSKHTTLKSALNALSKFYGRSTSWVEHHMGVENDLGAIHRNLIIQYEQESGSAMVTKVETPPKRVPLPLSPNFEKTSEAESVVKADTIPKAEAVSETGLERVPKGLEFYKPRRKEKYWTGNEGRYNSLDDAMRALAKQYGVNEAWIDQHMGNTNDLTKIHQNIQNSLKK